LNLQGFENFNSKRKERKDLTLDDQIYHKLAKVLDTLPNGFPTTATGIEMRILKKIF